MDYDYDLIVIGAGSGGVRAARLAAQLGHKVCVIEEDRPGGTCVLRGCVPKKLMVYASQVTDEIKTARGLGWSASEGQFDWPQFRDTLEDELTRLSGIYESNLVKAGVEVMRGQGAFIDPHTIAVKRPNVSHVTILRGQTILVAVGGWPIIPEDVPGARELGWVSHDIFRMEVLPQSIVIVGGGYIAVEFAGIFNGLGTDVTLVCRGNEILRGFDEDLRKGLHAEMALKGTKVLTDTHITQVEKGRKRLHIHLETGEKLKADQILYATGRRPKTGDLNLKSAGVSTNQDGAIAVNPLSQTSQPHIYAIGDVTNRVNLTPVAIREAVAFVETVYKDTPTAYDHGTIPTAVFSQPEIGTVGITESEALARGLDVDIYATFFRSMKSAFTGSESRILMKLIVDRSTDVVLGCHMLGGDAGEIIQMAGIAVKAGLTKAHWDETCAVHPTAAEEFVTLRDPRRVV